MYYRIYSSQDRIEFKGLFLLDFRIYAIQWYSIANLDHFLRSSSLEIDPEFNTS